MPPIYGKWPNIRAECGVSRREPSSSVETRYKDDHITFIHLMGGAVITFLLWCMLFVLCWPVALLALVIYPILWLILLPFRLIGIAVDGLFRLLWLLITLPVRLAGKML